MSSIQEKEIKEILISTTGQRLLACLLLGQPLTAVELQRFPQLSFQMFDPSVPLKKPFPNVATISKKTAEYPHFNPLFENKELYGEDRIIRKAMKSGLIISVPSKKDWKKHYYYYLNPDIAFYIDNEGLTITEDSKVIPTTFRHHIVGYQTKQKIALNEVINVHQAIDIGYLSDNKTSLPSSSLPKLFALFWWLIRHPGLISETIDAYRSRYYDTKRAMRLATTMKIRDLPSGWRRKRYLLNKALRDGVFYTDGDRVYLDSWFEYLIDRRLLLYFVPSFALFSCFSNYQKHAKVIARKTSAMELLNVLTSEEYVIVPEKRPTVFTSLLLYDSIDTKVTRFHNTDSIRLFEHISVTRNTQLAEQVIINAQGPMYTYLKSSKDKHLLFSEDHQYILPHENG